MRIVGSIDHPTLKITIFKMGNKLSVKFESGLYEQTFKFREGEGVEGVDDLRAVVDESFIAKVMKGLRDMHQLRSEAMRGFHRKEADDEFEEII